jgi:hypothetical protein
VLKRLRQPVSQKHREEAAKLAASIVNGVAIAA